MKKIKCLLLSIFTLSSVFAQTIEVERYSENVIILNENYFRSVAIKTNKGVVLIDTREPLEKMEEIKQIVKLEFDTDSFCYIINTHGCPEHILGNPAFEGIPVIMNENFFNRKKLYARQKHYIDSLEIVCANTIDSLLQNEICSRIEEGKNWRNFCVKALEIEPDIAYSENMNLYFDNLQMQMTFTGLGHGYSTFIYLPEENLLHVSTLSSEHVITKFTIPEFLDGAEFLAYQTNTLKNFIGMIDSATCVLPAHGEDYSGDNLKQMLAYYVDMYEFAGLSYSSEMDFGTFKTECSISKRFADVSIFRNLNEEEIQRHNENIDWLWNYFKRLDEKPAQQETAQLNNR